MLREIVGATVSVILVIYTLWFIVPLLKTAYNNELPMVNQTNPTMVLVLSVSNGWFTILPLLIVLVGGYLVYIYATRREGYDV